MNVFRPVLIALVILALFLTVFLSISRDAGQESDSDDVDVAGIRTLPDPPSSEYESSTGSASPDAASVPVPARSTRSS